MLSEIETKAAIRATSAGRFGVRLIDVKEVNEVAFRVLRDRAIIANHVRSEPTLTRVGLEQGTK